MFSDPDICGWLTKAGESRLKYRRKWFMLTNNCLYYFNSKEDIDPVGFFPLEDVIAERCKDRRRQIQLRPVEGTYIKSAKYNSTGQLVHGMHRQLVLRANDFDDCQNWLDAFQHSIMYSKDIRRFRPSLPRGPTARSDLGAVRINVMTDENYSQQIYGAISPASRRRCVSMDHAAALAHSPQIA